MNIHSSLFVRIIRLCRLVLWLIAAAVQLRTASTLNKTERDKLLQKISLQALSILNVKIHINTPPPSSNGGLLIVANHISWLDILTITATMPTGFIAMKEMENWPILGKIAKNIGTVFIDRSSQRDIDPINTNIAQALYNENNVCFFPEARTSLGNNILPLKAALFESAIMSHAAVQPIALRYYDAYCQRTERVSFANISLLPSLWNIISMSIIHVHLDFGATIWPQTFEHIDRFILKDQVEHFLKHKILEDSPNPERL